MSSIGIIRERFWIYISNGQRKFASTAASVHRFSFTMQLSPFSAAAPTRHTALGLPGNWYALQQLANSRSREFPQLRFPTMYALVQETTPDGRHATWRDRQKQQKVLRCLRSGRPSPRRPRIAPLICARRGIIFLSSRRGPAIPGARSAGSGFHNPVRNRDS